MSVENEWGRAGNLGQGGAVWCGETVVSVPRPSTHVEESVRERRGFWELDLIVSRPR